jgi:hypothetical protein
VREPKNDFWPVLRKALVIDLKSFLGWLTTKVEQVSLVDTEEAISPGAVVLYAKKFEFEGDYVLHFLKSVHKANITLGLFSNMTENLMWYDNGDRCAKTKKRRSFKFDLVCNNETKILMAYSPDECAYKGVFGSPVHCNATSVADLDRYKLKRLQNLTKLFDPPK